MKRIVITGLGAVTPLGSNFHDSWAAAKAGRSGIRPITRFDVSDIPWKYAGEIKESNPEKYLGPKELLRLDPFVHYAVCAALMAVEDAGLNGTDKNLDRARYGDSYLVSGGVIVGSSRGGIVTLEKALMKIPRTGHGSVIPQGVRGRRLFSPYLMPATTIGAAASSIAYKLGIKGHCLGISNACASGMNALGEALRLLRSGWSGPVIAGGAEAPVCRLGVEGYGAAGVVSRKDGPRASRPFDRSRDGFVVSEGACMVVLEELEMALKRGADIYGEVTGYADTVDAFHQTRPAREGEERAMRLALADAGINSQDIDFISAHGTSTPVGDVTEAMAVKGVFGERGPTVPVTAVKSMTGHMLAASGPLEAAFAVMGIREGVIPPAININDRDPECDLNLIMGKMEKNLSTALCNSFGFGGVNAVLVLKAFKQ